MVKQKVEKIEHKLMEMQGMTSSDRGEEEIISWVPNMGFSRSKDTISKDSGHVLAHENLHEGKSITRWESY